MREIEHHSRDVAIVATGRADVDFDLITVVDACGGERGQR